MKTELFYTEDSIILVDLNHIVSENDSENDEFFYVEEYNHYCKVIAVYPKPNFGTIKPSTPEEDINNSAEKFIMLFGDKALTVIQQMKDSNHYDKMFDRVKEILNNEQI